MISNFDNSSTLVCFMENQNVLGVVRGRLDYDQLCPNQEQIYCWARNHIFVESEGLVESVRKMRIRDGLLALVFNSPRECYHAALELTELKTMQIGQNIFDLKWRYGACGLMTITLYHVPDQISDDDIVNSMSVFGDVLAVTDGRWPPLPVNGACILNGHKIVRIDMIHEMPGMIIVRGCPIKSDYYEVLQTIDQTCDTD